MPNISPFLVLPASTPGRALLGRPRLVVVVAGAAAAMPACLRSLLRQHGPCGLRLEAAALGVVLAPAVPPAEPTDFLAGLAAGLPFRLRLPPAGAPGADAAGRAWRAALETALDWAGPDGVILTLEATAVPAPGWAAALVQTIAEGAAVATAAARPRPGPAADYAARLAAIAARLDPGAPPGPGGARSLALTGASLAAVLAGALPAGGPTTLLEALRRRDAAIRPAPGALVDTPTAEAPERLGSTCRRLRARAALHGLWRDGVGSVLPESPALWALARRCGLPAGELARLLGARHFGAAWEALEAACPALRPQPLPPGALRAEALRARILLAWLGLTAQRAGRPAGGLAPGAWPGICID